MERRDERRDYPDRHGRGYVGQRGLRADIHLVDDDRHGRRRARRQDGLVLRGRFRRHRDHPRVGRRQDEDDLRHCDGELPAPERQATTATSLIFLVVALLAIGASVFMFVRLREAQRELEEKRRGGEGGGSGGMG